MTFTRVAFRVAFCISIHTLRVEGDLAPSSIRSLGTDFNPHPPSGGWRLFGVKTKHYSRFQSTLSEWRVTCISIYVRYPCKISIHTLRMEGDHICTVRALCLVMISIHTLRMEGDVSTKNTKSCTILFQSTPSVWRVTSGLAKSTELRIISIHTLRMEGDYM